MKIITTLFIISFVISAVAQKSQKRVETIITDLNNDQRNDTIQLFSTRDESALFNKIAISLAGAGRQLFSAKNGWGIVDTGFLAANKNAVNTNSLFLYKAKGRAIILLFGVMDGGGYREDFSIIKIKNDKAKMVLDKMDNDPDIEIPIALTELDNNQTDFIFRNYGEIYKHVDSLNADIAAYNPYLVYTIGDTCVLNKPLTKQYNEDHYVFAGYTYSENIKVLYPRDKEKKPRVIE
ncbi:MAG TPA: hypothetical protein VG738_07890 [Chitinophagaceae bacterium]|nr:hypothetical protein [Chitinophagaceae bacterium]